MLCFCNAWCNAFWKTLLTWNVWKCLHWLRFLIWTISMSPQRMACQSQLREHMNDILLACRSKLSIPCLHPARWVLVCDHESSFQNFLPSFRKLLHYLSFLSVSPKTSRVHCNFWNHNTVFFNLSIFHSVKNHIDIGQGNIILFISDQTTRATKRHIFHLSLVQRTSRHK